MNILGHIRHKAINVTANTKKPQAMRDEALEGFLRQKEKERKKREREEKTEAYPQSVQC